MFLHGQETCLDFTLGALNSSMFFMVIVVNFICPVLLKNLEAEGMFKIFGIICAFFLCYTVIFVKDSTYKTEFHNQISGFDKILDS